MKLKWTVSDSINPQVIAKGIYTSYTDTKSPSLLELQLQPQSTFAYLCTGHNFRPFLLQVKASQKENKNSCFLLFIFSPKSLPRPLQYSSRLRKFHSVFFFPPWISVMRKDAWDVRRIRNSCLKLVIFVREPLFIFEFWRLMRKRSVN